MKVEKWKILLQTQNTKLSHVLDVSSIIIYLSKALISYLLYKISSNSSDNFT
jgi:hypothetical protein